MNAVVFDFETTGLTFHSGAAAELQPRIIEIGAALLSSDGKRLGEFSALVNPECTLPPEITRITGIHPEQLVNAPPLRKVLPELADLFGAAGISIAHNHPFDSAVLRHELARVGHELWFPWPARSLCTVQAFAEHFGRRPKLTDLYAHVLGRPLAQTHRALDDVNALCEIVVAAGLLS